MSKLQKNFLIMALPWFMMLLVGFLIGWSLMGNKVFTWLASSRGSLRPMRVWLPFLRLSLVGVIYLFLSRRGLPWQEGFFTRGELLRLTLSVPLLMIPMVFLGSAIGHPRVEGALYGAKSLIFFGVGGSILFLTYFCFVSVVYMVTQGKRLTIMRRWNFDLDDGPHVLDFVRRGLWDSVSLRLDDKHLRPLVRIKPPLSGDADGYSAKFSGHLLTVFVSKDASGHDYDFLLDGHSVGDDESPVDFKALEIKKDIDAFCAASEDSLERAGYDAQHLQTGRPWRAAKWLRWFVLVCFGVGTALLLFTLLGWIV